MRKKYRLSDLVNRIFDSESSTLATPFVFAFLWFFILLVWAVIRGDYLESHPPTFIDSLAVAASCFFLGCAGAVSAKQKVLHQIVTIRGKLAVILSILWTITSWGFAVYALYIGVETLI